MKKELTPQDVVYAFDFSNLGLKGERNRFSEYDDVYEKLETALEIDKEGYNVYFIDDFSKEKLETLTQFIKEKLKNKNKPQDICYVVREDEKAPEVLFLPRGMGKLLKEVLEEIQKVYSEATYSFYNSSSNKEKENIVNDLQKRKSDYLGKLVKMAEDDGFIMRSTQNGFTFVPVKEDGKTMSESDYDDLEKEEREDILNKISELKNKAQKMLEDLKDMELEEIEKIKELMDIYYREETKEIKFKYLNIFSKCENAKAFLNYVCEAIENQIKNIYSISYDDDEEQLSEAIYKYLVNVIVDNSKNEAPPVIFEEDPSITNLLGSIEYENKNGTYVTDVSLIKAGSILKANGGCLILRVSGLLNNISSYYQLKKSILSGKVNLDYNRGYLELLSLGGLKPEPVEFYEKIILIGDYEFYDLLYTNDEDFKKIFKIRTELRSTVYVDEDTKKNFINRMLNICSENGFNSLSDDAIMELAKFSARKAEDKNKLYIDDYELSRILTLSDNRVKKERRTCIDGRDIRETAYPEEIIEKEINDNYKQNKVYIDVQNRLVGVVNGLSVIDTGYFSFGKPIRITCSCYKGDGNIVDVQKESNLSGNIHNKAISTLRGYINNLLGGYEKIPVDFHLSFEQVYGRVDGDSASVAELVSMISSLSKIGIKQNIAVTGSINQFGEVQPIGGVNEKIEGFFKICKLIHNVEGKGVLIPKSNESSLVLSREVEEEIKKGNFHIYSMEKVEDAIEVLMGETSLGYKEIMEEVKKELKKYNTPKGKNG